MFKGGGGGGQSVTDMSAADSFFTPSLRGDPKMYNTEKEIIASLNFLNPNLYLVYFNYTNT